MRQTLLPLLACLAVLAANLPAAERPNILVIVADDLGYADLGFQGAKDIPTPHLDALARRSVQCTSGYVTHPFCSPTRAGLLSGRYQQRFGHENNPAWLPADDRVGLPLSQTTLPQVLKTVGYVTGAVGKWHLGAHPKFHPLERGFDEYVGMLGGGHVYLPDVKGGAEYTIPIDRNRKPEPLREYLTDFLGREAAAFVTRHKAQPWFLYLAFNAPHTPLQATDKYLDRVRGIPDEKRKPYGAMICALDDAVGVTLAALRASGKAENTLVFFFSDNGGPISVNGSRNDPLRGAKGQVYEGGMRVPFLVSWPAKLPQDVKYHPAVSSLDVFATAAAITGAQVPPAHKLDGVDLIPFLTGGKKSAPHERLFWRTGGGAQIAVREGDWKWLQPQGGAAELYDLGKDIGEANNLASKNPEVAARLERSAAAWNSELVAPVFESPRPAKAKAKK
jgi:arylsulfatase A-like enzyme